MSKSISANNTTHLAQTVTTLAMCWHITRVDGTEYFFTTHDQSIIVPTGDFYSGDFDSEDFSVNQEYLPAGGFQQTAIANDASMAVDNLDVMGILDSEYLNDIDLRAGKFDFATIEVFLVNWASPSDGIIKLRKGTLGEVIVSNTGVFKAELRGLTQQLSQSVIEVYTPECRADLGDSRCKVPINPDVRTNSTVYELGDFIRVSTSTDFESDDFDSDDFATDSEYAQYNNKIYECTTAGTSDSSVPVFDTTPGNTTTDGTAVFTAREAWTRHGTVLTVVNRKQVTVSITESRAVDDWFNQGVVTFDTGLNAGASMEVRDWVQSSSTMTLYLDMRFNIEVGDKFHVYPGCDKRSSVCKAKWAIAGSTDFDTDVGNIYNFRGEPFVPGQDEYFRGADAR